MEHNNDIDELFQTSFENFEVSPPAELKAKIDERLEFGKRRKRRFILWLFGGFVLAGGLLLAFLIPERGHRPAQTAANQTGETSKEQPDSNTERVKFVKSGNPAGNKMTGSDPGKHPENKGKTQNHNSGKAQKNPERENRYNRHKKKKDQISQNNSKNNTPLFEGTLSGEEKEKNAAQNPDHSHDPSQPEPEEQPADSASVASEETAKKADSSMKDSITQPVSDQKSGRKPLPPFSPLLIGLQFGLGKAFNSGSTGLSVEERNPFYLHADVTYRFSPRIGGSTGINYFKHSETLSNSFTVTDTVETSATEYFTLDTFEIVTDTSGNIDTNYFQITDSIVVTTYTIENNTVTQQSVYRVSSFALPLMIYYQQRLTDRLFLDLMAGGVLSYQKLRFEDTQNPDNQSVLVHHFGFRACLKTNIRYQFSRFGVSLNTNFSYDMKPVSYQQASRKRQVIDYGFGVWYNF